MLKILVADKSEFFREGALRILKELYVDAEVQTKVPQELTINELDRVLEFDILIISPIASKSFSKFVANVTTRNSSLKIIIISDHTGIEDARYWFSMGVSGYMSRDADVEEMSDAISTVLDNKQFIEVSMLVHFLTKEPFRGPALSANILSARERQVMEYLLNGLNVSQIAEKLNVKLRSASNYKSRVFQKLDVRDSQELIRMYPRSDRLETGDSDELF